MQESRHELYFIVRISSFLSFLGIEPQLLERACMARQTLNDEG